MWEVCFQEFAQEFNGFFIRMLIHTVYEQDPIYCAYFLKHMSHSQHNIIHAHLFAIYTGSINDFNSIAILFSDRIIWNIDLPFVVTTGFLCGNLYVLSCQHFAEWRLATSQASNHQESQCWVLLFVLLHVIVCINT